VASSVKYEYPGHVCYKYQCDTCGHVTMDQAHVGPGRMTGDPCGRLDFGCPGKLVFGYSLIQFFRTSLCPGCAEAVDAV